MTKPGEARRSKINMVMVGTMTIANTYLCLPSLDIVRTHTFLSGFFGHGSKRRLLLGRKVTTNLDSIFESRDITLPTKVGLVKAMVFPVAMYRCELDYKES